MTTVPSFSSTRCRAMKRADFYELMKSASQRSDEFNDCAAHYLLLKGQPALIKKADFEDEHGTGGPLLSDRGFSKLTDIPKKSKNAVVTADNSDLKKQAYSPFPAPYTYKPNLAVLTAGGVLGSMAAVSLFKRRKKRKPKEKKANAALRALSFAGRGSVLGAVPGALVGAAGSKKGKRAKGALKGALIGGAFGGGFGGMHSTSRVIGQRQLARSMDTFKSIHGPGGVIAKSNATDDLAKALAKGQATREVAKKIPQAGVMPSIVKKPMGKNASVLGAVGQAAQKLSPAWKSTIGNAAGWGAGTGAINAILAKPGESRVAAGLKGLGAGAIGGALAGRSQVGVSKFMKSAVAAPMPALSLAEVKQRAAERYPQQEDSAIIENAEDVWGSLKKKYTNYKKARLDLIDRTEGPKKAVTLPGPLTKQASIASSIRQAIPKGITDPGTLALAGAGAAMLGLSTYLGSRPQKSLGGKSKSEVAFEADVKANKTRGDTGYSSGIGKLMTQFQHGLAVEKRKHPGAAAATGAAVGGGMGLMFAKVLGALKN